MSGIWARVGLTYIFLSYSEIYQVTGPVERFAGQIASQGYVVGNGERFVLPIYHLTALAACPSTYHEFEGPDPIPYDVEGKPPSGNNLQTRQFILSQYRQGRTEEISTRYTLLFAKSGGPFLQRVCSIRIDRERARSLRRGMPQGYNHRVP